ncbi:hypothetical protein SAMN05216357_10867 [Porphyromonadaceae bacterium KH3CP3RA]|nr:hypothetical protein SAMN05216357_10867 [Porphyromonadaceae bacterium KH3CP3RA]
MNLLLFICKNRIILLSMMVGALIAYIYWFHFGIYWGTYPLSGEWWVNCIYGGLFGGLLGYFIAGEMKRGSESK